MSHLRFQYVFYFLMGLSAIVAFVVPNQTAGKYQPRVEILFAPVSRPVASVGRAITRRTSPTPVTDTRPDAEIRSENEALKAEVMQLKTHVAELTRQNNELGKLTGSLKEMCQVTRVVGSDSGNRDSLSISATSFNGIQPEMYVLVSEGLVGQVARSGALGSQVKLITDPSFRIRVHFMRFEKEFPMQLPLGTVVVQGIGKGQMKVTLPLADLGLDANLKPLDAAVGQLVKEGDYVTIEDRECPSAIQGLKVGRVSHVVQLRDARLYAEIQIEPYTDLQRLGEVMVMTREK
jgi:cell shape-determining protein MreC